MSSTSAPPSVCHQPQLLDPPSSPSLPLATHLSLLPLPSPSIVAFSSFTAITANPNAFLLHDVVARSLANFVTTAVSLSPSSSLLSQMTSGSSRPSHFSITVDLVSIFINPLVPTSQLAVATIDLGFFLLLFFLLDAAEAKPPVPSFPISRWPLLLYLPCIHAQHHRPPPSPSMSLSTAAMAWKSSSPSTGPFFACECFLCRHLLVFHQPCHRQHP